MMISRPNYAVSNRVLHGFYIKTYQTKNLLDPDWTARVSLIEAVVNRHNLIPATNILYQDNGELHLQQKRIIKKQAESAVLSKHLGLLAEELSLLSETNFVHGDINYKNLVFDGNRFFLIDIEPSLRQIKNNRETLMYTPPYIAVSDYLGDKLSILTDKVGFYFFCRRMLDPVPLFSPLSEMNLIKAGMSIIERHAGMNETEFSNLNYQEILHKVAWFKSG